MSRIHLLVEPHPCSDAFLGQQQGGPGFDVGRRWRELVVKVQELSLLSLEGQVQSIQDKGDGDDLKGIELVEFTILYDVPEERLLIGQFLMILHMVQQLSEGSFDGVALIDVPS